VIPQKRARRSAALVSAAFVACTWLVPLDRYDEGSTSGENDASIEEAGAACPAVPAVGGDVIWTADMEAGDLFQWLDGGEQQAEHGGSASASDEAAHCGQYSVKQFLPGASDGGTEAYSTLSHKAPDQDAYYSFWIYFPESYDVPNFWSIATFASEDLTGFWRLNVYTPTGGMRLTLLYEKSATEITRETSSLKVIPPKRWVHVEILYEISETDGRITVWQDGGDPIYEVVSGDEFARPTIKLGQDLFFALAASTDGVTPEPAVYYVDDVVISKTKLGP